MRVETEPTSVTLSGGTIVDGSGRPGFPGNVVIEAGNITEVGGRDTRGEVIDVTGCVVAPGFVDIHSHADWLLGYGTGHDLLAAILEQGITTAVVGNCGSSPAPVVAGMEHSQIGQLLAELVSDKLPWSWRSFGEYLDWLDGCGVPINCAFLVGHGMVRSGVMRDPTSLASRLELREMQRLVGSSIDEGAFGVSFGLEYFPGRFAPPSEVAALAAVSAQKNAMFATHTRGISSLFDHAMDEVIGTAQESKCRLQISHVNPMGRLNWSGFERLQERLRAAGTAGVDVGFDAVTYVAWTTDVVGLLPHPLAAEGNEALVALAATDSGRAYLRDELARHVPSWPAWRAGTVTRSLPIEVGWDNLRIARSGSAKFEPHVGSSIGQIAARESRDPIDCYCDWLVDSAGEGRALIVGFSGDLSDEGPLERIMSDPGAMPGTDTAVYRSAGDALELTLPEFFGTMPRFLGHFGRDRALFSVEEAVARMTSLPCERARIQGRGQLKVGYRGDVTVFDPATVQDQGDYLAPRRPRGIEYVLVNGQPVVRHGAADVERLAGQVLRSSDRSAR